MHTLNQYNYYHRESKHLYKRSRLIGLIPLVLISLLIVLTPYTFRPRYLLLGGLTLGLQLLATGAHSLPKSRQPPGRIGRLLINSLNRWYAGFQFAIENAFLMLVMILLYIHLTDLGVRGTFMLTTFFMALVICIPLKRLTSLLIGHNSSKRLQMFDEAFRALVVLMCVLMIAGIVTQIAIPADKPFVGALPPPVIVVWVLAILVIIADAVLFIDRAFVDRHRF